MPNDSKTSDRFAVSTGSTYTSSTTVTTLGRAVSPSINVLDVDQIQNAVYAYIQSVRALGRTEITTAEIAKALGLPLGAVDRAAVALRGKGVKRT